MQTLVRKLITGLFVLLFVGGQVGVSYAVEIPGAPQSPTFAPTMGECGSSDSSQSAVETPSMSATSSCGETQGMVCMGYSGSGQCVISMVLGHSAPLGLFTSSSQSINPGARKAYQGPSLDVLTPPPDSLS